MYVARRGPAPLHLQYSHRCHSENCINLNHGIWEVDQMNKNRAGCRSGSHLVLPDETVICLCKHDPPCLTPIYIPDWSDSRIVSYGIDTIFNY